MATVNHHNTQKLIGGNRASRHYDKFLNTIPIDDPGITAGIIDDVVPETNKVWVRSLEAGFGIGIDVVETDHHPRSGDVLNKIVIRAIGGGLGGLKLFEGEVFIGNSLDEPISTGATAEGQVVVAGSGPNFDFAPNFLSANFVTNTPSSINNIVSTNVQDTLIEIASERSYIHVDVVDPTVNNDAVDTATLGEIFKIGDLWINTVTDNVWQVTDVSSGAAV